MKAHIITCLIATALIFLIALLNSDIIRKILLVPVFLLMYATMVTYGLHLSKFKDMECKSKMDKDKKDLKSFTNKKTNLNKKNLGKK